MVSSLFTPGNDLFHLFYFNVRRMPGYREIRIILSSVMGNGKSRWICGNRDQKSWPAAAGQRPVAGLVPPIHVFSSARFSRFGCRHKARYGGSISGSDDIKYADGA